MPPRRSVMRIAFEGGTAGLLQTMHPAIGQGLINHSDFFDDPVDRVFRSLPGILGAVYSPQAGKTGMQVRDFHHEIKGTLPSGRRYHALEPATFWWAHATFQRMVDRLALYWDRHRLTEDEDARLYAEGCEWYRRYGVSTAPMPPDRAAFDREFMRVCDAVLEPNPASDHLIAVINRSAVPDMSTSPYLPSHPRLRPVADTLLPTLPVRAALAPPMRLVIFGGLPPSVRDRFGIRWTRSDQAGYRSIRHGIRLTWRYVPRPLQWHQTAAEGWHDRLGRLPRFGS